MALPRECQPLSLSKRVALARGLALARSVGDTPAGAERVRASISPLGELMGRDQALQGSQPGRHKAGRFFQPPPLPDRTAVDLDPERPKSNREVGGMNAVSEATE